MTIVLTNASGGPLKLDDGSWLAPDASYSAAPGTPEEPELVAWPLAVQYLHYGWLLEDGAPVAKWQPPLTAQSGPSAVVDYADATDYTKGQFIRTGLGRLYVVWIDFTSTGDLDADLDAYCDGTYILAQQGGFTRQVLVKQSATDFDVSYASPQPLLYTSIPVGSWVLRDSLVTPTLGAGTVYVATNQFVSTGVWNDDKVNLLAVSVPAGGLAGQVLTKASNDSGDADWEAVAAAAVAFTPAGTIAAVNVQAAIEEVAAEAGGVASLSRQAEVTGAGLVDGSPILLSWASAGSPPLTDLLDLTDPTQPVVLADGLYSVGCYLNFTPPTATWQVRLKFPSSYGELFTHRDFLVAPSGAQSAIPFTVHLTAGGVIKVEVAHGGEVDVFDWGGILTIACVPDPA